MSTEQEQWKLIDPATAQEGDQWLDERGNWLQADEQGRSFYSQNGYQVRRRMTGAEVHAEWLLKACHMNLDAFGDSDEGAALLEMNAAVCAAEGREPPVTDQILRSVLSDE